jgi:hypothetical protein
MLADLKEQLRLIKLDWRLWLYCFLLTMGESVYHSRYDNFWLLVELEYQSPREFKDYYDS